MPYVRNASGVWELKPPAIQGPGNEQSSPQVTRRSPGPSCQALRHAVASLYRLDDFDQEKIGAGFFSDVYKVTHKASGQVMVLKMNIMPSNRSNVLREVQLMNGLSHPNILRFIGVCVNEGQLHALIEFANGGSLEELLANRSRELDWPVRIRLACDVAKGLKYLHSRNVMHRDLTSKNILIKEADGRLTAVVADFGLATKIPNPWLDKSLPIVGSPYWMAPECICGKKYNERADIFSYGIILCEIISRREADPEILPRTQKFGVDYVAFSKMASDCPLHFLHLAFICCQIDPRKRPPFPEIVERLEELKCNALMAVILADLSRLGISSTTTSSMSRMILERILDHKVQRQPSNDERNPSAEPGETTTSGVSAESPRRLIAVTSSLVGRVMSKDDAYYAPHRNNPFPSRFRNGAVKVGIDGGLTMDAIELLSPPPGPETHTPPPTPAQPSDAATDVQWLQSAAPRGRLRSRSLPGSGFVSRSSSEIFGYPDTASDTGSSIDSALSIDVSDGSSWGAAEAAERRKKNAEQTAMMVQYLEDLEALFGSSVDSSTTGFYNDGSSCASLDDAMLSPSNSFSSRDGDAFHRSSEHRVTIGSPERFRALVQHWETRQSDVTSGYVLPVRLRYVDPCLVQRFNELRRMWEEQQLMSTPIVGGNSASRQFGATTPGRTPPQSSSDTPRLAPQSFTKFFAGKLLS